MLIPLNILIQLMVQHPSLVLTTSSLPDNNAPYKKQEDNCMVVPWIEADKIFYEKRVVGSGSTNTFIIKYPSNRKDYYNPIISQLNSSFKTPEISTVH